MHISDDDLESYYLGFLREEVRVMPIERHLEICSECACRAQETREYIAAMKTALRRGDADGS